MPATRESVAFIKAVQAEARGTATPEQLAMLEEDRARWDAALGVLIQNIEAQLERRGEGDLTWRRKAIAARHFMIARKTDLTKELKAERHVVSRLLAAVADVVDDDTVDDHDARARIGDLVHARFEQAAAS